MSYCIDAWLDRPDPYVRVVDSSGTTLVSVRGEELSRLFESGELDPGDLCVTTAEVQQTLLECLIAGRRKTS